MSAVAEKFKKSPLSQCADKRMNDVLSVAPVRQAHASRGKEDVLAGTRASPEAPTMNKGKRIGG